MNKSFHKSTVTEPIGVRIPHEAMQASSKAKRTTNWSCTAVPIEISNDQLCSRALQDHQRAGARWLHQTTK